MKLALHKTWLNASIFAFTLAVSLPGYACGLEPSLNGGFSVSYQGSLDVAVAVADARRSGVLQKTDHTTASNAVQLQHMLSDLERLQSRLDASNEGAATHFSLVLVGPGLWSHFHMSPGSVETHYHVDGPLDGHAVVLTHPAVLGALLSGQLTTGHAAELGLIAYTGSDAAKARKAIETGLQSTT